MKHAQRLLRPPLRHPRWLPLLAVLPLFGVMAAFGIAPDTDPRYVQAETTVEELSLPEPAITDAGSFDFWREERIQRGDTLASLLRRMQVAEEEIGKFIEASRRAPALARLIPGRTVLARVTAEGNVVLFRYLASDERLVSVNRINDEFRANESTIQTETRPVLRSGEIQYSLFGATDKVDIPDAIASQLAEVFSGDIDFHRDLRRGDRFSVVYEAQFHEGRLLRSGRLMAAEFVNDGKTYRAVYFRDPQGREGYFTPDGKSLRRPFLRSPMPFTRISSGYTKARYHPVLKEWRAHRGIDYAAPTGTPIRSVADAKVSFAGRKGGYGKLIVLDHQGPYSTAYGHLSRFAKGLRRGSRVAQGEIIGYVGATGLATGPHLHYEFRVKGVQTNPLTLKLPDSFPLDKRYKEQFDSETGPQVARLDMITSRVSALE